MTCAQRHVAFITFTILPALALLLRHFYNRENARWTHRRRVGTLLILEMGLSVRLVRIFVALRPSADDPTCNVERGWDEGSHARAQLEPHAGREHSSTT